jgi:hypothetical protein
MKIQCTEIQKESMIRIIKNSDDCPFGGFDSPECKENECQYGESCDNCQNKNIQWEII